MSDTLQLNVQTQPAPSERINRLARFDRLFAPTVASWVRDPAELFLLAPSTRPPLTPAKVVRWTARGGDAYLLFEQDATRPVAYGELNRMTRERGHFWLGHLLVDPTRRGCGTGVELTRMLVSVARRSFAAQRITLVVFPENSPAVACYERCGFRQTGEQWQRFRSGKRRMLRYEL